jgi:hypothetical protein
MNIYKIIYLDTFTKNKSLNLNNIWFNFQNKSRYKFKKFR